LDFAIGPHPDTSRRFKPLICGAVYMLADTSKDLPIRSGAYIHIGLFAMAFRWYVSKELSTAVGEKWCAQGDDFRTFLTEFLSCLQQGLLALGLSL
jgi:hypothetical protein